MITTINGFKQYLLNESWRVKFETWPEIEDELEHLDQNNLHDHKTGITFDNTKKHYRALVDVKQGKFNDWNFGIYTNNDQVLIWGNPNNKQGEVFKVIEGDMNKAREIADHLVKTGDIDLAFDTISSNDKLVNNVNENVDNSLEPLYTVKDLELAFEAGVDSIEYDENHGYMNKSSFTDFLNSLNNNVNENKINLNNLTSGDKIVIYNKQSHITYNGEFVKIQNNRIYFKNLDHPSTDIHSFIISNNIEVSIKSKINENVDTTQLPKALEDIDERRPNRMKKPNASGYVNDFAGRGGVRGLVYIQDEAERIMQDKYGRERGTKMWKASINAPQRGAMFKMADDVMKEKMFLYHQAGIYPRNYWEVSYYALWKLWMESQGLSYKVDSDEDVANKKAEKERLEREENERKAQAIKDQKLKQFNDTVSNLIKDIDPAIKPDSKDMARIASTMSKNDPEKMAKVMASAIKDKNKAIRRGLAVIEWFKQNKPTDHYMLKWVAQPFLNKAKQL